MNGKATNMKDYLTVIIVTMFFAIPACAKRIKL